MEDRRKVAWRSRGGYPTRWRPGRLAVAGRRDGPSLSLESETMMTTPIRPVPETITRWVSRMWWLRRLDAVFAWACLLGALAPSLGAGRGAVLAFALLCLGLAVRLLRFWWRPISGGAGLLLSRRLRPGDRAWYVRAREADLVVVTARAGARVVIARPDLSEAEGLSVRRTRVLLLPADRPGLG